MSAYPTATERPRMVRVSGTRTETPTVKTLTFRDEACSRASPGQFVMVWIPGVDEVPMSLSKMDADGLSAVTVKRLGEATAALQSLGRGGILGIRGPYGRGFTVATGDALVVGGGCGMAPLAPLVERLAGAGVRVTVVVGAETWSELLFLRRVRRALSAVDGRVVAVTEDGSYGVRGLATGPVREALGERRFDVVYTCGPERMMQKLLQLSERHGVLLQASLERYMRCGVGICGSCCIGGYRVCRDGPVFTGEQLREVTGEFGVFRRDADGRRTALAK